ncbi:unnamed protein product, partial [Nesidiocoris tenuis]
LADVAMEKFGAPPSERQSTRPRTLVRCPGRNLGAHLNHHSPSQQAEHPLQL